MSDLVGDARTRSADAQEAVRLLAVSALVEGRDRAVVAALFKMSVRAVDNWWTRWRTGGRDALPSRPRGRRVGEHQVLSEAEQAAVRQAVLSHTPSGLGLSGQLWTRADRRADLQAVPDPLHRARCWQVPQALGTDVPASGQAGRRAGSGSGPRLA
ncbi:helix-turn-helix domain-containing protein [Streptomyces sp. NBC_01723]|uniref:helix-turn-helix domain-containing protein n=1 Tax=Streptomyces sp. NBC_01723 TaxID=2975921 RepID=UPI003FCD968F